MVEPPTAKINEKQPIENANHSPTAALSLSTPDLEAARSSARASATTSPALSRHLAPPTVLHPHGSAPASVTSLPVNGIESAPTHRRRRNRRRRQQALEQTGQSGLVVPVPPRRANSLPAHPVSTAQPPAAQPVDWLQTFKNLDTLLQPAKKLAVEPTLTQSFSMYII